MFVLILSQNPGLVKTDAKDVYYLPTMDRKWFSFHLCRHDASFHAVINAHLPACRLLVARGANVDLGTDFVITPLMHACKKSWTLCVVEECAVDIDQQSPNQRNALMGAASQGHLAVVNFLIEHGADIQHTDVHGYNALMLAVKKGRTEMARHLVSIGASTDQLSTDGKRARDLAEESGNAEMVDIFRTTATDNGRHAEGTDGQQNDQQQH
ncbi:hypothetical protein niasHT_032247 [Heterodera trifolii]|uniref:Ankyrin repeat protein n=1 Tax=Heterodera trifolii TaxID=157864 RepID=A0ABD2HY67_9BILA